MHSLFSRRLRGNRFTERELLENWSLGAQPRGTIGPDSCKSATRGGKIIPVLDSQDPTNLDSFPARVLAQTTWSRAKTLLWTLDKTYDSVKERKKERKNSIFILPFTFTLVILFCLNNEKEMVIFFKEIFLYYRSLLISIESSWNFHIPFFKNDIRETIFVRVSKNLIFRHAILKQWLTQHRENIKKTLDLRIIYNNNLEF